MKEHCKATWQRIWVNYLITQVKTTEPDLLVFGHSESTGYFEHSKKLFFILSEISRLLITTSKLTLLFHKKWRVCIYRDVFSFFFFPLFCLLIEVHGSKIILIYIVYFLFTASWCDPFKNISVYKPKSIDNNPTPKSHQ